MNFNFLDFLKFLNREILDFIYKRKCINCDCAIKDGILCKNCLKTVENLPPFTQGVINGYRLFCACYYKEAVKNLIHHLKFKHNKACALFAAEILFDFFEEIKENNQINFENALIIPVPTHINNKYERGYDNVVEICKQFQILSGLRLNDKVLRKIKYTKPQYLLSEKERKNNPAGSFSLDKNFKYNKGTIILVDDIFTTGATLNHITALFRENNIKNLVCLTLAKTSSRKN